MKKTKFIVRYKGEHLLGKLLYLAFLGEHRGGFTLRAYSRDAYRFDSPEDAKARTTKHETHQFALDLGYELQVIRALPAAANKKGFGA